MSVYSSGKRPKSSGVSSILKKTPSVKTRLSFGTPTRVRFSLPHSKKVRDILQNHVNKQNSKEYENLVCLIRDAVMQDEEIRTLLKEISECVLLLDKDLRLFVEALLLVNWTNKSERVVKGYQKFLVDLVSAHSYHAKLILERLVASFVPTTADEWVNGVPTDEDYRLCVNVHTVLRKFLTIVPMCREILLQCLVAQYPYFKKSTHSHEYYLHNLLWVLEYEPKLRVDVLHLIVSRLIILDVNSPRREIERAEYLEDDDLLFQMDEDLNPDNLRHPVAHTLDVCMSKVLDYIKAECHDANTGELSWEKTKALYHDILTVFDKLVLTTYDTHHVQFLVFYMCSFKPTIVEAFLNYLWKKVCTPNVPAVHRQSAVAYIASLVARSHFVSLGMLKGTLQEMSAWIHSYIQAQDGVELVNQNVRIHAVFYSVCQAVFYAIAFRHNELCSGKKNISFLETLNLPKMVTCPLNPLRVCQPAVVQTFAAVTRMYQLAYCYAVIEHNSRQVIQTIYRDEKGTTVMSDNLVEDFFPFDPCLLKRARTRIQPFYRDYVEHSLDEEETEVASGDVDDFLGEQSSENGSHKNNSVFSYGSSPGFKFKM